MDVITAIESLSRKGHHVHAAALRVPQLRPQCRELGRFLKRVSDYVSTYSVQLCLDQPDEVEKCVKGMLSMMDRAEELMKQCGSQHLFRLVVNAGYYKMQFQSVVRLAQVYLTSLPKPKTPSTSSRQDPTEALVDVSNFAPYDSLSEMEALSSNLQDLAFQYKASNDKEDIELCASVQHLVLEQLPELSLKLGLLKCDLEEQITLLRQDIDALAESAAVSADSASERPEECRDEEELLQLKDVMHIIDECVIKADKLGGGKVEHPNGLICPISGELMTDPVVLAESGHTYERLPIEAWLHQQGGKTDPLTGVALTQWPPLLIPNMNLRKVLQEYLKDHPQYAKSVASLSAAQDWQAEDEAVKPPPPTEMPPPQLDDADQTQGAWTPLHIASYEGDVHKVYDLIQAGADVNGRGVDDWTPLHWATLMGRGEVVVRLLQSWADVNLADKYGRTPSDFVEFSGNPQPVQALLEAGASIINANDKGGGTPLHTAAYNGDVHVVGALLATGASANKQNKEGWTALHCASITGHTDVVDTLLGASANVNAKLEKDGWTPLHLAACSGHADTVQALVAAGADVDAKDKTGYTPLHAAAQNGHPEVVKALVEGSADVNVQDKYGWSPLHWAACKGNCEVAIPLVNAGADVNAKDKDGSTPRQWASRRGYTKVVQCMSRSGSMGNETVVQQSSGSQKFWRRLLG